MLNHALLPVHVDAGVRLDLPGPQLLLQFLKRGHGKAAGRGVLEVLQGVSGGYESEASGLLGLELRASLEE